MASASAALLLIPPPKSLPFSSSPILSLPSSSHLRPIQRRTLASISQGHPQFWRISAGPQDALPSETPIEATQRIVSSASGGDERVSTVVSSLLVTAFIGLSLLTIGVIYLAVQDFLQKREREKFEKEEAEKKKKKKGGKKTNVRARTGPRGFGQKIDEEEEDDDD